MREEAPSGGRLDGWKSIAQYLGYGCRTVQRWDSVYGLPIRRFGGSSGSVFAYASELEDWLKHRGHVFSNFPNRALKPVLLQMAGHQQEAPEREEHPSGAPAPSLSTQRMWSVTSIGNSGSIARAYREAIAFNPDDAAAYAGLAQTLIAKGVLGNLSPLPAFSAATAAVNQALEIDPKQFDAIGAGALLKVFLTRDWDGARRVFDETLSHHPSCLWALLGRGLLYIAQGRLAAASGLLSEACRQNPLSTTAVTLLCWSEYLIGEYGKALLMSTRARTGGHSGIVLDVVEALSRVQLEGPHEHIAQVESLPPSSPRYHALQGVLGYAFGIIGQRQRALDILEALTSSEARGRDRYPYSIALTLIGLNETQEAMEALVESYHQGFLWSLAFLSDPILATTRSHPHYSLFMGKISNPEFKDMD